MVLRICMGTAWGRPGVDAVEALRPGSSAVTATASPSRPRARSTNAVAMALVQAATHDLALVVAGPEAHASLRRKHGDRGGGRQRAAILKGIPGPPPRRGEIRRAARPPRRRADPG